MKQDNHAAAASAAAGEQWQEKMEKEARGIQSVCVYCGSSSRVDERFRSHAAELGRRLGQDGFEVIYGGGRVGLMGIVADAALNAGGKVVGIIPQHIQAMEIEHHGLTELHVVDSMHTRKRMMAERADAFVILPGGFGTLDEAFEIITWKKLQLHDKPIILFDDGGFWTPLLELMRNIVREGFALDRDLNLARIAGSLDEVMRLLRLPAGASAPVQSELM